MVATGTLLTFVVAAAASLFMAWTIGAGSSGSTPFAAAVGANAISVMRAGFLVGILGFAGAVLQGANVTQAVGTQLIQGVSLTATAAIVGLLAAAVLVAVGIFTGYPIATAFTVTGAVIGVGLALGGDPAWPKYRQIATLWVLTPFAGGGVAYGTARLLRSDAIPARYTIATLGALVGIIVSRINFTLLGPGGAADSIADTLGTGVAGGSLAVTAAAGLLVAAVLFRGLTTDPEATQRRFLLAMGGLVAFSAGGSQVGLALGPLIPLLDRFAVPLPAVLAGGGFGLLLGSWTGAPRMIKALAQDYSSLGPLRSIAALIPSFVIAQSAVAFGIPVSFNEIVVSAIIGAGYAASDGGVSRRKVVFTVLAWIGSLAVSLTFSYGAYTALDAVLV
ncbi:MAG: anion permease [Haloarculaceae archaeon]